MVGYPNSRSYIYPNKGYENEGHEANDGST